MPYQLSRKQLDRLNKGHPLSVALPPPFAAIESTDNGAINEARLHQWAVEQLPGLGRATIESASVQTIWVDCEPNVDGLTDYFGSIIPDISRYSPNGLPAIPVSVVVCEIVPNGYVGEYADRIQWPLSYVSPTGYGYGGKHEDRFAPA